MSTEATPGISAEQLKDILKTFVEESRKPLPPTEAQLREIELKQEERKANAEMVHEENRNRAWRQKTCNHMQNNGRDGSKTAAVYVDGVDEKFLICQRCQKIIRPAQEPDLFNHHFQMQNMF